ncbi:hypothetical protein [Alteribacillus sp. HJP-4]|uniref:hypothetical protein n=1 Tax=Alteribacillus sp. HJP-4 TaxID=2775394 RepID=UPI0035CD1E82
MIFIFKKGLLIGIIGLLLVSLTTMDASAANRIIPIEPWSAEDIGLNFTTKETVSRSELVDFLDEVKRAEKDADVLNNIRYGIATSAVAHPLTQSLKISMGAGGASGLISSLIINKDLGSNDIQSALNKSTAKNFDIAIKYEQKSRGQDKWYEATAISVNPA